MLCSMKKEYPQIVLGLVFARQVALVMLDRLAGWRLKKLVLARIAEMDGGGVGRARDYKLLGWK